MFRHADIGRVWVPVELPAGEGDDPIVIHLLQDIYTRTELRERERNVATATAQGIIDRAGAVKTVEDLGAMLDQLDQLEDTDVMELVRRTHDWRGVVDNDDTPSEFTARRFAALLDTKWFLRAVSHALLRASREGVRKNSSPGHGGMPAPVQA